MISPTRLLAATAVILACTAPASAREDRPVSATERIPVVAMQHTRWTAADGAPSGVSGITQTPDGWLWIASSGGLFRFDGVRFQRAPAALAPLSSNISTMGLLADGSLWIAYRFGGASLVQDGRMRHFRVGEHNMPGGTSSGLAQDGDGRLWLGSGRGLMLLDAAGAWQLPHASLAAPSGKIISMLLDRQGVLWVRTATQVFSLSKGAARFASRLATRGQGVLAEHPDGSIWTSDMLDPGLHLVAGTDRTDAHAWRSNDLINAFIFDRSGASWQPISRGILKIDPAGAQRRQLTDKAAGLSGTHAWDAFEDSEGNVWLGTENGVDRFKPYRLKALPLPRYIAGARPLAARPEGGVWIDRSFMADPDSAPRQIAPQASVGDLTTALHPGPNGTLWSGGIGGLWRIDGDRREAVAPPAGLADPQHTAIFSMAHDGSGALWVSMGRRGLYTLKDGAWRAHGGVAGLAGFGATAMAGAPDGRMWFGSTDDRLAILDKGQARQLGRADGLGLGTVTAILPAGEGAWIGGENGVAHFDGKRFVQIAGRGGDPFAGTTGLVFDKGGTLWMNGGAGISAVAPEELRKALARPGYRVPFERLDYRDGLPGTASGITPLPSAVRSSDGTLWFSTTSGTVGFDPATLQRNTRVPPVLVTALRADGREYLPQEGLQDGLRIGPRTGTLDIDFTALSLRAPERMRFRYRLDGVDQDWQEPDGRRSARYMNLAPGPYRFRVIAANDDGVWNGQGAQLHFTLAPSLTQTVWFQLLCGAALLAALWLLHRMRLRRLARQVAARMGERLRERERIARELHDTLLQSIHGLMLKMGAAVRRLREDERQPLQEALDDARRVLGEGRDRVAGLRGESVEQTGLALAIADYGRPLAREAGVVFEVVTTGEPAALGSALADDVFAIAREAIWNAMLHARAQHVCVTLDHAAQALLMTVADDGRGIPREVLAQGRRAGHWGIPGMRERAARVGALEVTSREGGGTTWRLTVALRNVDRTGREDHAAAVM